MTHHFVAISLFVLGALAGTGCGSSSPVSQAPGTQAPNPSPTGIAVPSTTFSQINAGLLQPSCVSCHTGTSGSGGVDLSTYAGVVVQVSVGNPGGSAFYNVIAAGTMPPSGPLPQAPAFAQEISSWISAGALDN